MSRRAIASALGLVLSIGGCTQIQTSSRVEVMARTGAMPPPVSPHGEVTARGADIEWHQRADALAITVYETRRCRQIHHDPVTRIEYVERKAGMAIYWEYGIAVAFLAVGLTGLIAPQVYSPKVVGPSGERIEDTKTGYRIGGVFTGIGAVALAAGIADSIRSRDETHFADAYRVRLGDTVECAAPRSPIVGREIELLTDGWSSTATTDARGRAEFPLPSSLDAPPPPPTKLARVPGRVEPPAPVAERSRLVVRIDDDRTAAIDYLVPFSAQEAANHRGRYRLPAEEFTAPLPTPSPQTPQ